MRRQFEDEIDPRNRMQWKSLFSTEKYQQYCGAELTIGSKMSQRFHSSESADEQTTISESKAKPHWRHVLSTRHQKPVALRSRQVPTPTPPYSKHRQRRCESEYVLYLHRTSVKVVNVWTCMVSFSADTIFDPSPVEAITWTSTVCYHGLRVSWITAILAPTLCSAVALRRQWESSGRFHRIVLLVFW